VEKQIFVGVLKLALKSWVAKMAATVLNFGTVIVLSRNLGAGERGTCAFYTVVIAFALVFNELAAGSTAIYLQKHVHWKQIRRLAAAWSWLASGLLCTIFWWLNKIGTTELLLLWNVSFLNGVVTIQYNILLGNKKYLIYNVLSVLTPFLILASMVALALLRLSAPLMYLVVVNGAVAVALLAGWLALRQLPEYDHPWMPWLQVARRAFGSGLVNQAGHVVSILNNRYIYYILPAASLGVFTNALSLAEAALLIPGSMGQIYYSQAANTSGGFQRQGSAERAFRRLMLANLFLILLVVAAVFAVPGGFYTWMFGPQFTGVKTYLSVLVIGALFYSFFLLTSYWQSARGHFHYNLLAGAAGLISNAAGLAWLWYTDQLLLDRIAWLMSGSYGVVALVAFWLYRRERLQHTA
jgi:O-antigen/teichoic acid export membrane protein